MTASYGLSSSHRAHHEYSMRDNVSGIDLHAKRTGPLFRASLFVWAGDATPAAVVVNVTSFLWQQYGRGYLTRDIRPQIMPFDVYLRLFSYNEVLFDPTISSPPKKGMTCAKAVSATVDGHEVWRIANMGLCITLCMPAIDRPISVCRFGELPTWAETARTFTRGRMMPATRLGSRSKTEGITTMDLT